MGRPLPLRGSHWLAARRPRRPRGGVAISDGQQARGVRSDPLVSSYCALYCNMLQYSLLRAYSTRLLYCTYITSIDLG